MQQMLSFPNAQHDDMVDSTTQAIRLLRDMSWLKVKSDPLDEPIDEAPTKTNPYAA
jgi:hypothetical protein